MGLLVEPKIIIPKIEIPVDENDESGAKNIMNVLGPAVPVIKVNDYVLSLGDIKDYSINVSINKIPTFSIDVDDSDLKIRKALGKQEIDTVIVFVGNDKFYHKYNGIITSVVSDAGDSDISISGIIYNPKLYQTIQKGYNNKSVSEILQDICTMTDMGLFTYDNSYLTSVIEECLNPNKRYIDFFTDMIERFTDNMWCFDNYYYLHVGNINTIRNKPVDTYTVRNEKLFDSPQPIVISTNPGADNKNYDVEVETKLKCQYYTINTNIGNGHIISHDEYNVYGSDSQSKNIQTNKIIGIGEKTNNIFSRFVDRQFPFYRNVINKEIAGRSVTLEMIDILYEIVPFQIIDLELFIPRDGSDVENYSVIDEENSGKKVIIGYTMSYIKSSSDNKYPIIKQKIEVI